jgi:hypothetical protein
MSLETRRALASLSSPLNFAGRLARLIADLGPPEAERVLLVKLRKAAQTERRAEFSGVAHQTQERPELLRTHDREHVGALAAVFDGCHALLNQIAPIFEEPVIPEI